MSGRPKRLVVSLVRAGDGVRGTVADETDHVESAFEGWLELLVLIERALGPSD